MTNTLNPNLTPKREVAKKPTGTSFASWTWCIRISLLAFVLLTGCESPTPATKPTKPRQLSHRVTAASYPLAYFTKRLVGDSAKVLTLAPPSDFTRSWRPSRAEILSMQQSDIIFVNGTAAPFATWLPHVTLPDSKICPTANEGLALADMIAVEDIRVVHSHGPEGEHSHPTMVAYTWLDPAMAAKQVGIMASRLTDTYPKLKSSTAQAEQELTKELTNLSSIIDELQTQNKNSISVLTDSPNLKFLTRALGLNDIHLNWQETPSPSEAEAQLKEKLSFTNPRPEFMLFTSETTPELQSVAESLNLRVIFVNPIARELPSGDYLQAMSKNLNQLKPVFGIDSDLPETKRTESEPN